MLLQCRARREWWIIGVPLADCPECGPYPDKKQADDDRRGLAKFFRMHPEYKDDCDVGPRRQPSVYFVENISTETQAAHQVGRVAQNESRGKEGIQDAQAATAIPGAVGADQRQGAAGRAATGRRHEQAETQASAATVSVRRDSHSALSAAITQRVLF